MKRVIRANSQINEQGRVEWAISEHYDDECARQLIISDRPKSKLKDFSYEKRDGK